MSTLIKWFPDRPGLATGLAIMGFGGGALVASAVSGKLLSVYDSGFDPTDPTSIASGSSVATLFLTLGIAYLVVMSLGAFLVKVPADDWKPDGWEPKEEAEGNAMVTTASVSANNAIRTPQFWLLWIVLFCNVTAGIGILEQAAPMIQDFFREGGDTTVSAGRGGGLRGAAVGVQHARTLRLVLDLRRHRPQDDVRRLPRSRHGVLRDAGPLRRVVDAALRAASPASSSRSTAVASPRSRPTCKDMFGSFQVGAIHGRLLIAWSAAGVVGPLIINGFLDAEGTPGELTADAYRPALLTMVGVLAIGFVANLLVAARGREAPGGRDRRTTRPTEPADTTVAVHGQQEAGARPRSPGWWSAGRCSTAWWRRSARRPRLFG